MEESFNTCLNAIRIYYKDNASSVEVWSINWLGESWMADAYLIDHCESPVTVL